MSIISRVRSKQNGKFLFFFILLLLLCGCENKQESQNIGDMNSEKNIQQGTEIKTVEKEWTLSYDITEENIIIPLSLIQEIETEKYFIKAVKDQGDDKEYPQIVMKEKSDFYYDIKYLNDLLKNLPRQDYSIFYADEYYVSLWYGVHTKERAEVKKIYNINLQNPIVDASDNYASKLLNIQDGNDYSNNPWPTNGLTIHLSDVWKEIEDGNCYLDTAAYTIYKQNPKLFIESIGKQYEQMEEGGYEEAYSSRFHISNSKYTYLAYIKENRVGFYIRLLDRWDNNVGLREGEESPYDFRVEIEYDWKKHTPDYNMSYEISGVSLESETCGTVYYPQVKGFKEEIQNTLNNSMKEWVTKNLEYINIEEWQKTMDRYSRGRGYWTDYIDAHGAISIEHFVTTFQNDSYLCIFQQPKLTESTVLRFAEQWKRYSVFDLETGKSLKLGDVIRLDEAFVKWLKKEKKIEATGPHLEGMQITHAEAIKMNLDEYPVELLLNVLENTEFWMKQGQLYFRLPYYEVEFDRLRYSGGGSSHPNYIQYTETRISLEDLGEFLQVEPW